MTTSPKQVELDILIQRQLADALGRAAKEAGHEIAKGDLTCEMGAGFTVLTAPIVRAEPPTDKELSRGVNLLFAYVAFAAEKKLKPGFYVIRITTAGFDFKAGVKVSFVNAQGRVAHTLAAKAKSLKRDEANDPPSFDEFTVRSFTTGRLCGSRKCFTWKRKGFLDWEFGCEDPNGNTVNCV